jgi:hypothetical protein
MTRYAPTRSLVNSTPDFPNGLTFSNGLTSNSGEVLLTQNSDQYGTNLLRMQNRTGTNGIILDASLGQSGIDLMDMAFRSAHATYGLQQQQIRMEGRSSALARTGGYGNEIQIGTGVRFCKKGGFIGPTTGLIATLVAGSFTVVLTTGSTATLVVGQGFSKTSTGGGDLGTGAIITEIDPANTTTFTVSVAHATLGSITFTALAPTHNIESMGASSSSDFNTWLGTSGITYAVGTAISPPNNGSALAGSGAILKYFPSHWHMIINSGGTTIRGGTASTSTTTGTLVVGGGVGISGSANVGGSLSIGTQGATLDEYTTANQALRIYSNTANKSLWVGFPGGITLNNNTSVTGTVIIGSGEGTATVAGNTLRGPSAVGTDIAGGSLTIAGGTSTGAGLGGSVIFQTAPAGSTGTVVNALAERMRIIASGNVGIGTTAPGALLDIQGSTESLYLLRANGANSNAPNLRIRKSRGTVAAKTTVVNGDYLGHITWEGYDGTNFIEGAGIYGISNGTVATNSIPTDLQFLTLSGTTLSERMRITSTGVRMTLSTTPTVGQVLAATDTSGTLGWSSGTTYYRQFMFTS